MSSHSSEDPAHGTRRGSRLVDRLTVAALVPMLLLYPGACWAEPAGWSRPDPAHGRGGIHFLLWLVHGGPGRQFEQSGFRRPLVTIMCASLLLLGIMGQGNPAGPVAALWLWAVVCCGCHGRR